MSRAFVTAAIRGAVFCIAVVLAAPPAAACTIEIQLEHATDLYRISPLVDDGLSNATRVNCTRGELVYNPNQTGWVMALDEEGRPLILTDIRAINWRGMTFLVFVNEHGMVGMRFGPPERRFLDSSDRVRVFPMADFDGELISAWSITRLEALADGTIFVEVQTGNDEYCAISSDSDGRFDFSTTECQDYS